MKDDFWNDIKNSSITLTKLKQLKNKYENYEQLNNEIKNLEEITKTWR